MIVQYYSWFLWGVLLLCVIETFRVIYEIRKSKKELEILREEVRVLMEQEKGYE